MITEGYPVRPLGAPFTLFGQTANGGIPLPFLIFLASGLALWWVLSRTRFGRNIYAVGGNRDAAALERFPSEMNRRGFPNQGCS